MYEPNVLGRGTEPSLPAGRPPADRPVSRRTLLGGALAVALAGAACSPKAPAPAAQPPAVPTVASLRATTPFYIAHRGGGGDWPEMTAFAYAQASKIPGLQAMEISVCITADGVLVCSHDPTTLRVTGKDYTIAKERWDTLANLRVSAADTVDPGQPTQPLARFDEVFERYIDRFVLFVEPKVGIAETPLLQRLREFYTPQRVVWKQQLIGAGFAAAKREGFTTWGYVLDQPAFLGDTLTRLAASPDIDMLGIPVHAREGLVTAINAAATSNAKQTIAWAITTPAERDLALKIGAAGLMTSTIAELMPGVQMSSPSP